MTRSTLATLNQGQVSLPTVRIAEFGEFQFPSGTLRLTTADRDIDWGGFKWLGDGRFIDLSSFQEVTDLKGRSISFILSGIDAAIRAAILADRYQYANVSIWIGFFDQNWKLLTTPHVLADSLLMSTGALTIKGGRGGGALQEVIELKTESWNIHGQRDSANLIATEQQKLRYAGDTCLDNVPSIVDKVITWGKAFQRA